MKKSFSVESIGADIVVVDNHGEQLAKFSGRHEGWLLRKAAWILADSLNAMSDGNCLDNGVEPRAAFTELIASCSISSILGNRPRQMRSGSLFQQFEIKTCPVCRELYEEKREGSRTELCLSCSTKVSTSSVEALESEEDQKFIDALNDNPETPPSKETDDDWTTHEISHAAGKMLSLSMSKARRRSQPEGNESSDSVSGLSDEELRKVMGVPDGFGDGPTRIRRPGEIGGAMSNAAMSIKAEHDYVVDRRSRTGKIVFAKQCSRNTAFVRLREFNGCIFTYPQCVMKGDGLILDTGDMVSLLMGNDGSHLLERVDMSTSYFDQCSAQELELHVYAKRTLVLGIASVDCTGKTKSYNLIARTEGVMYLYTDCDPTDSRLTNVQEVAGVGLVPLVNLQIGGYCKFEKRHEGEK